jgi:hypothetical protein
MKKYNSVNIIGVCGWTILIVLVLLVVVGACCTCITKDDFDNLKDFFTNDKDKDNEKNCNIMTIAPSTTTGPRLPPTNKFIMFQIDCGGLNNIRMQFETLTVLSWLSGRTIVLPPASKWYLMGDTKILASDIFDFDCWASHVPILEAKEFLEIKNTTETTVDYTKFIKNIEKGNYGSVYEPNWSPGKTKFKMKFLNEGKNKDIWYFYCDRLERFRNLNHRMLGNTECYFQVLSPNQMKDMRKLIWDALKYKEIYYTTTVKIMKNLNLKVGKYNAVHLRNWEGKQPQYQLRTQEEIIDNILKLPQDEPILFLSQNVMKNIPERLRKKVDRLFTEYKLVRPPQNNPQSEQSVVEMLLAVGANKFFGSPSSTYSIGIMNLRGNFSRFCNLIDDTPNFIDGKTNGYLKCSPLGKGGWDFDKITNARWKDFYKNV